MKFYDKVQITVQSGKWGNGVASGRREKWEAWGGPAWWDGGKWWSIIFVASKDEYTLMPYRYKKTFKAKNGLPGKWGEKYGAHAEDVILKVPRGILIKEKDTEMILAHLKNDGEKFCLVEWGRGGLWNIHFATPSNQYPTMYLLWEPWIKKQVILELQLLGDVALIGTPSVGKSTLINAVSNVKAKTADYEFTTLIPNIGVVEHKWKSFVMVDVPWLIAGASSGKWLGSDFLRHILKARIWTIMLDAVKDIPGIDERSLLLEEIISYIDKRFYRSKEFGPEIKKLKHILKYNEWILRYEVKWLIQGKWKRLLKKAIITVVNKYDVFDEELWEEYLQSLINHMKKTLKKIYNCTVGKKDLQQYPIYMSALTHNHIEVFLDICITLLSTRKFMSFVEHDQIQIPETRIQYIEEITETEKAFLLQEGYLDEKEHKKTKIWEIYDEDLAYLTFVLPRGNDEAELRYRKTLQEKGYIHLFEKNKIHKGDVLKIISIYEGSDDKYILRE